MSPEFPCPTMTVAAILRDSEGCACLSFTAVRAPGSPARESLGPGPRRWLPARRRDPQAAARENHLAAHDRKQGVNRPDGLIRNRPGVEEVAAQDHQVGELAGPDRAQLVLLARKPGLKGGVHLERLHPGQ